MKTKIYSISIIMFIILFSASCKKDDNGTPSSNNSTTLTSFISSGTWKVSYYHESSVDRTTNFSGYTFTFNSNGTMISTHSSISVNGTWSSDDSNNEFHMTAGNTSPLNDLNNGWTIITKTSSEIDMKDDNSTHNEELHFTKI